MVLFTSSCRSNFANNCYFVSIESDPIEEFTYNEDFLIPSFYHEPRGGGDDPIINRKICLKNIRSINLYNVQTNKIKNFKAYFYVFRWGTVGGSLYEPIDCIITAYPSRINIKISNDFVFENHTYDQTGDGKFITLQRKYYINFNYFENDSLSFHFLVEENENEGIYKTEFEEDIVGNYSIYIGN